MKTELNHINKFRGGIIVMSMLVFIGLASCTSSNNESKPLPRLPAQLQAPVQQNQPAPAAAAEPAQNTDGQQVMLNPPHGQPGHRCEIPVGAPLNTPAPNTVQQTTTGGTAAAAATAPTVQNNSLAPTLENASRLNPSQVRSTATPPTGPKPANNPPHGQPWHRCDIAVGSPLP